MQAVSRQKISAVLRKTGIPRSKTHSTRIRGWQHWTEGYCLTVSSSEITIRYTLGDSGIYRGEARTDRIVKGLRQIEKALAPFEPKVDLKAECIRLATP